MTCFLRLRVFMPVQRAQFSWAATSSLHSPPQQASENYPCIPAPATAAYWLWAGKHMQSHTVNVNKNTSTSKLIFGKKLYLPHQVIFTVKLFAQIWDFENNNFDIRNLSWKGKICFFFKRSLSKSIKSLVLAPGRNNPGFDSVSLWT